MSLFTISIIGAVVLLIIGVAAIVRGKPLAGILAIILAIAIAAFGYREDILGQEAPPSATVDLPSVMPSGSDHFRLT